MAPILEGKPMVPFRRDPKVENGNTVILPRCGSVSSCRDALAEAGFESVTDSVDSDEPEGSFVGRRPPGGRRAPTDQVITILVSNSSGYVAPAPKPAPTPTPRPASTPTTPPPRRWRWWWWRWWWQAAAAPATLTERNRLRARSAELAAHLGSDPAALGPTGPSAAPRPSPGASHASPGAGRVTASATTRPARVGSCAGR